MMVLDGRALLTRSVGEYIRHTDEGEVDKIVMEKQVMGEVK